MLLLSIRHRPSAATDKAHVSVPDQGTPDRWGFSLIELLVVIAIVGVLSALLFPALGRAKVKANAASCLNRLRQWNVALLLYTSDNEDYLPRESFLPGGTQWNFWAQVWNPLAGSVWYNALPPLLGSSQCRAKDYAPSVVRPDFYRRHLFFHCPSAVFPPVDEVAYFSFAMNSKLILFPATTVKLTSVQIPSATVTFLDNRLPGERAAHPLQPTNDLGQPSAYASRFVVRHDQRGTLVFADGHCTWLRSDEVVADGFAILPQTKVIWTADPVMNPNVVE